MSWVCKCCSSNNEDGESVCFVCGTERSKAEIKAEELKKKKLLEELKKEKEAEELKKKKLLAELKRKERRSSSEKTEERILDFFDNLITIAFLCSSVFGLAVVIINIMIMIFDHSTTDIIEKFLLITDHARNNFDYIGGNIQEMYSNAEGNIKNYLVGNIIAVVERVVYTVKTIGHF